MEASVEMQEDAESVVEKVWMQAISREWQAELADTREDIYTLEDGDALSAMKAG